MIVKTNNVPEALIPHSLASPTLVASTAIMKYSLFVPNYRLENYILAQEVKLTRESMASWLIYVSENYLIVMFEWLRMELKDRPIINADETHGKVNQYKELAPLTDDQGSLLDKEVVKEPRKNWT